MTQPIRTKPAPPCDDCGAVMILRKPKPDQDWDSFWGCPNYPECKGTQNIDEDGYPISKYDDHDTWDTGVDIWETANG